MIDFNRGKIKKKKQIFSRYLNYIFLDQIILAKNKYCNRYIYHTQIECEEWHYPIFLTNFARQKSELLFKYDTRKWISSRIL